MRTGHEGMDEEKRAELMDEHTRQQQVLMTWGLDEMR